MSAVKQWHFLTPKSLTFKPWRPVWSPYKSHASLLSWCVKSHRRKFVQTDLPSKVQLWGPGLPALHCTSIYFSFPFCGFLMDMMKLQLGKTWGRSLGLRTGKLRPSEWRFCCLLDVKWTFDFPAKRSMWPSSVPPSSLGDTLPSGDMEWLWSRLAGKIWHCHPLSFLFT